MLFFRFSLTNSIFYNKDSTYLLYIKQLSRLITLNRKYIVIYSQTLPNSAIHFSYLSNLIACAAALVDARAFAKSSFDIGPIYGDILGSAGLVQSVWSILVIPSISFISLLSGFIAASLHTNLISLPLYPSRFCAN